MENVAEKDLAVIASLTDEDRVRIVTPTGESRSVKFGALKKVIEGSRRGRFWRQKESLVKLSVTNTHNGRPAIIEIWVIPDNSWGAHRLVRIFVTSTVVARLISSSGDAPEAGIYQDAGRNIYVHGGRFGGAVIYDATAIAEECGFTASLVPTDLTNLTLVLNAT